MVATQDGPPPKPTTLDWIAKYWPMAVGIAALLYAGVIRDDRAQRAATDFYKFATEQSQFNSQQASTNSKLTTLLEAQDRRISRLEDKR
jgi:hypothetical protein